MFLDILVNNLNKSMPRYPDAMRYLNSRYVTKEEVDKYEIGYSKVIGVPESPCEDRARFMEEFFRGRRLESNIVFPLKNSINKTVGLIYRSMEGKVFKKFVLEEAKLSGFFFGLYQALPYIYQEKKVFLVEGQFDYFALVKIFPNTVATLMAGMSEAQYKNLSRFCDTIITVFDSDEAGERGRDNAMEEYKGVKSMSLKYFKDPAKCLESLKPSKFKEFILRQYDQLSIF